MKYLIIRFEWTISLVVWVNSFENSSDGCSTSVIGCLDFVGKARWVENSRISLE